jgi:methyl-accepting chemotaxis protein
MKIKTKLCISAAISIIGIIGIAAFSLTAILLVKEKITLLTSRSTPLQVKTVQLQQTVDKLSADLLQLGFSHEQEEVQRISAAISEHRQKLETIHRDINRMENLPHGYGHF